MNGEAIATSGSPVARVALVVLALAALAAFGVALVSLARAWLISSGHPPFEALGMRKWVMGSFVIRYMPPAALPHVRRWFAAVGVFMLCLLAVLAIGFIEARGTL